MPSKIKPKSAAAHQHDKRHESGLAAPGKRVIRQRSHNNLQQSGNANGRPTPPLSQPVEPVTTTVTGVDHHVEVVRTHDTGRVLPQYGRCREEVDYRVVGVDRGRTSSDVSQDGYADMDDGHLDDAVVSHFNQHATRRPTGTLAIISTVLSYYPLRDAISTLIILMALPATLVLVIQALFASLTFVPPTAIISFSSIRDIFNATSLGYPALATLLFVDLLFYLCWLPLWRPLQNAILDLSQAVVAVSLSGAAASTSGPTYSIVTCSTLVCVVHVLRYKAIHLTALDYLRSVLHKPDLWSSLGVSYSNTPLFNIQPTATEHNWMYTAARTILGIHIVSQGLTTCIRRSLSKQNEALAAAPALTRTDTESAPGHDPSAIRNVTSADASQATTRDGRPRESGRRRRRQANEVRGNQPLWAAIASTKVTFVKEMEQRDAAEDIKESTLTEKSVGFYSKPAGSRVWLRQTQDTEVSLSVELAIDGLALSDRMQHITAEELSNAFYVRVNGASWNSIKVAVTSWDSSSTVMKLDVFGLAPRTTYQTDIIATEPNNFLCNINFVTQLARMAELAAPVATTPPLHQTLRPSSPATTLRKSIEQASASLVDARNKSKKTKRDQRAAYSDIRKEINLLKAKLENWGGTDDKQARRLQQITQHKNQAEEAAAQVLHQIGELGDMPSEDVATAEDHKQRWTAATAEQSSAQRILDCAHAELDRERSDIKAEIANADLKQERLTARHQQRKDELARAAAKHEADLSARQRHIVERAMRRDEYEKLEAQMRFHIASMSSEADVNNAKAIEAYQQAQLAQGGWDELGADISSPPTPDHTRHDTANSNTNGFYTHNVQVQHSYAPRGRSSSMLSQYSGFTDNGDGEMLPMQHQPSWPMHHKTGFGSAVIDDRKESSSGSSGTHGSTASSSPRPDVLARPFVPSKMSPIAPPARKTASPQISMPATSS